jgi:aminopeptidase N
LFFSRATAVEPSKLFTAIDQINPKATEAELVSRFFAPWTSTIGFPLVTAERDGQKVKISQKRFMRNGLNHLNAERYNIPITYAIDSDDYENTTPKFVFSMANSEIEFNLTKKPEKYYILNTKQNGYYRVNYDEENWKQIKEALNKDDHDKIHVMNRAQIVDDLFNLARGGVVNYDTAIDIIRYIKKEKHYIPWLSAINHGLTFLSQRVSGEKDQDLFSWFIMDIMTDIYDYLKFLPQSTDSRTDIYNRINILNWACKYGLEDCIKTSKELFEKFRTKSTKVPKDHRGVVYCNAVRHGNKTEFDFLYDRFLTEDISAEQLNLLNGMSCTKDQASIEVIL